VELVTVHVDDPEPPEMMVGLQFTVSPVGGLIDAEILTVPVKPFWLVIVTVNVPVELPDNGRATKL
jgi:hypothetical protein